MKTIHLLPFERLTYHTRLTPNIVRLRFLNVTQVNYPYNKKIIDRKPWGGELSEDSFYFTALSNESIFSLNGNLNSQEMMPTVKGRYYQEGELTTVKVLILPSPYQMLWMLISWVPLGMLTILAFIDLIYSDFIRHVPLSESSMMMAGAFLMNYIFLTGTFLLKARAIRLLLEDILEVL